MRLGWQASGSVSPQSRSENAASAPLASSPGPGQSRPPRWSGGECPFSLPRNIGSCPSHNLSAAADSRRCVICLWSAWRYQPSSELAVREHLWKDEAQLGRCGLWKLKVTRKSSQDFCILLGVSRVVSEHPWAMRGWAWRRACPVFLKNAAEFQAKSKRWPVSRASSSQDTLLWRPWTLYHFPSALLCLSVCLSVYVRT